jgi:acyl carrier protein
MIKWERDRVPKDETSDPGGDVFDRLRHVLAFVLDIDAAAVQSGTRLADLPDWSSLTFTVLMVGIQKKFGITLEPERAMSVTTAGGLARVIEDGLAQSGGNG